ncbi:MAG: T9SS type A sorting domain-containing protein [Ignavibacteriae bacterium]|nr:T9SS C-terminal target domain-containing protein [Ignavibacteriota bacterium]NOH00182.1 T9SS type A sorting domain-containing protein [Ignavibacteriota bacterium]
MKHYRNLFITTLLALFIIIPALSKATVASNHHKSPMRSICDYSFVAHLEILDDDGRLLVWKAPLKGDIVGYILWWFNPEGPPDLIHADFVVSFYTARWEIYDTDPLPPDSSGGLASNPDANLLMAGFSKGQSLFPSDPPGSDVLWDGAGIVTKTNRQFRKWKGGIMYEGGPVVISTFPYYGTGKIRIHPRWFRFRDLFKNQIDGTIKEQNLPKDLKVLNNYPNPFNPSTTIEFHIAAATQVRIDIFNIMGQKVKTLLDQEMQAGNHKVEWNASEIASGIYFYKVQANGIQEVKRMILIK